MDEAAAEFQRQKKTSVSIDSESTLIVVCMVETNRFCHVRLSNYVDVPDEQTQTQFAALHIELGDGATYVAFRGTDDTLLGWREDFSMSFQLMPSQTSAAEYLQQTLNNPDMQYCVGGHSC